MHSVTCSLRVRGRKVVALAALGLLTFATPAGATGEGGSGTGTGSETDISTEPSDPAPNPPFCLLVKASEYQVTATGTVTANDTGVVYQGSDIVITYSTQENYYIAPEGTYGARNADGTCIAASYGALDPVKVSASVNAAGSASSGVGNGADGATPKRCSVIGYGGTTATGGYYRTNTNVTVTWTANCAVDGNVAGKDGAAVETATQFTFEGELNPVTGDLAGSYAQT